MLDLLRLNIATGKYVMVVDWVRSKSQAFYQVKVQTLPSQMGSFKDTVTKTWSISGQIFKNKKSSSNVYCLYMNVIGRLGFVLFSLRDGSYWLK